MPSSSAPRAAVDQGELLGTGHLAMTIDQGGEMDRYQGIVALDGESLVDAAHTYFRQSEQLPTFMRLAVARHYMAGEGGRQRHVAMARRRADDPAASPPPAVAIRRRSARRARMMRSWRRSAPRTGNGARILAATVEDHELLDPMLSPQRLLYRLFHEEGVRALPPSPVEAYCQCSRERVEAFLRSFGAEGLDDMREPDGGISVTCEFCATKYRFEPGEIA